MPQTWSKNNTQPFVELGQLCLFNIIIDIDFIRFICIENPLVGLF